ncbi:YdgA family protein [Acerihabitans sp. TG2]|uniref:YdgA family protein n=1 Tax=Acerihabitans sp. TG2 TaxID=3096008 RepID=UPI002B232F55|nr:YdgA family protein [Acerihabitans sp. TG2]MEA9391143.1 YdgA family protein [Acerihabitans sp. TG2]
MKKSLVAIGVIVILGAAWTGGAWYTGKQFEQRLPSVVADANMRIKTAFPEMGVKLVVEDYQRHLFSSRVNVVLVSDGSTGDNKPLKPEDRIVINEIIDHGPFPLGQLKKGVIIPSMASVYSQLDTTPLVKPLMEASQGKSPLTAVTRVSYNGDTVSDITLVPFDFKNATSLLSTNGGNVNLSIDHELNKVAAKGNIGSLVIGGVNQWQQHEQVALQNLSLDSTTHKGQQDYSIGDNTLKVKTLTYSIDGKDILSTDNLSQITSANEDNGKLSAQVAYSLDALHVRGQDFGSGKLMLKLSNLDPKAIAQFSQQYQAQAQQIMQQTGNVDPALQQQQISHALLQNLPIALKGNPYLMIAPLSWKNSKGESVFNLTLNLNDPSQSPASEAAGMLPLLPYVNKLDAKLSIPLDMATELTTQVGKLQGYSDDDAQKLAKQQIQGLAAMGQMFKLTTVKDNTLTSSLQYADNQVNLNGQKMSLKSFLGLFGLFGLPDSEQAQPQTQPQP